IGGVGRYLDRSVDVRLVAVTRGEVREPFERADHGDDAQLIGHGDHVGRRVVEPADTERVAGHGIESGPQAQLDGPLLPGGKGTPSLGLELGEGVTGRPAQDAGVDREDKPLDLAVRRVERLDVVRADRRDALRDRQMTGRAVIGVVGDAAAEGPLRKIHRRRGGEQPVPKPPRTRSLDHLWGSDRHGFLTASLPCASRFTGGGQLAAATQPTQPLTSMPTVYWRASGQVWSTAQPSSTNIAVYSLVSSLAES